jgi:hypothetical protein
MSNNSVSHLIKIGKKEHVIELYEKGLIYMNNIECFRKYEDQELKLRGDKDEGITGLEQVTSITLLSPEGEKLAHGNSAQLKFHSSENNGNIYSLIAITSDDSMANLHLDERNKQLGDYFVVIHDFKEFIKRMEHKLKESHLEYKFGVVNYYDPKKYRGRLDVFCKPIYFEYQKEYRIFVKREETDAFKIEIGSIEDISRCFDIENLNKLGSY